MQRRAVPGERLRTVVEIADRKVAEHAERPVQDLGAGPVIDLQACRPARDGDPDPAQADVVAVDPLVRVPGEKEVVGAERYRCPQQPPLGRVQVLDLVDNNVAKRRSVPCGDQACGLVGDRWSGPHAVLAQARHEPLDRGPDAALLSSTETSPTPAAGRGTVCVPVRHCVGEDDVLTELPDKIETESWVQLSDTDEAQYASAVSSRNLMAMRQAAFSALSAAKLERLQELVEEAAEDGMKVVVFSYFLGVLKLAQSALGPAVAGTITGSIPPAVRQQLIDEFTRRPGHAVLLGQVEAGGVGLNMQAASVVILTEPQWKPSTEEQAIARAHRMGQVRMVQVHRLLAKGSIDERIREIQQGKSLLFDEFARKSEAKEADSRSVEKADHRPEVLDDESVPVEQRVLLAERYRLGLD